MKEVASSVEDYIRTFEPEIQERLQHIRKIIREHAPEADEGIAYGMPGYKLHGKVLVYFAGHTNHVGFYALPSGHAQFSKELSAYKQGKGSVQFPHKEPMPTNLIAQIVQFRVQENALNAELASSSKKRKSKT